MLRWESRRIGVIALSSVLVFVVVRSIPACTHFLRRATLRRRVARSIRCQKACAACASGARALCKAYRGYLSQEGVDQEVAREGLRRCIKLQRRALSALALLRCSIDDGLTKISSKAHRSPPPVAGWRQSADASTDLMVDDSAHLPADMLAEVSTDASASASVDFVCESEWEVALRTEMERARPLVGACAVRAAAACVPMSRKRTLQEEKATIDALLQRGRYADGRGAVRSGVVPAQPKALRRALCLVRHTEADLDFQAALLAEQVTVRIETLHTPRTLSHAFARFARFARAACASCTARRPWDVSCCALHMPQARRTLRTPRGEFVL